MMFGVSETSFQDSLILSGAALCCLVSALTLCICCYGRSREDEYESNTEDSDVESNSKMSLMSYSSLWLPDQEVNVARIQPVLGHQSSINKKLGIRGQRQSEDNTDAEFAEISDDERISRGNTPPPITSRLPVLGRIHINIRYDFEQMKLNLHLISAENLPAKDFSGTSDPYVKIMLLPDRKHRLVSNIRRKSLNPRWDEKFSFEGYPYSKLSDKTMCLQVLDYDRFSRDDPIGEVFIPLRDIDIAAGVTLWQTLQPCYGEAGKLGEILVSLCYQPSAKQIIVGIISARSLIAKDFNGLSDPYVKIWLMHDGKNVEKQKTRCKPKNLNPDFNETFVFIVPPDHLALTCLSIVVMDRDIIKQNDMIGRIVIGMSGGPTESRHWKEMLAKSEQVVERWHVLKNADDKYYTS